ncbi:trichome birefringence-like protein 3, partial [Tanacetum coccineum]
MSDDDGVFYFKFASLRGLEQVLEQGPWLIRNVPLILTKWTPNMSLSKDNVTRVPVWVKLHKVPVVAYSDDGLSLIATQIGKLIMLDAFTSSMCVEAWGRIGYARALIEVGTDKELKQEVIMAVLNVDDEGATHTFKKIRPSPIVETDDDGFTRVTIRKSKGKGLVNQKWNFVGLRMPNPKPNLKYQPVKTTNKDSKLARKKNSNEEQGNGIKLKNLFEKLNEISVLVTGESSHGHGVEDIFGDTTKATQFTVDTENKDSDSKVEEVFVEDNPYKSKPKEASTSYDDDSNTSNGGLCSHGCQIIMGWNMDIAQVMVIAQSTQALHVKIVHKASNKPIFYSFIYAGNMQAKRRVLWRDLGVHKHVVRGFPWILMGDFNVALNMEDTYSGSSSMNSAMYEFKDCVFEIEVMDVTSSGIHYTWTQKPKGGGGVLRKLDHIMSNEEFIDTFPGAYGWFQPYRISDHSPAVLKIPTLTASKPKPFKFYNFLAFKSNFLELVDSNWTRHVDGHNMFKVVTKLKLLKKPMRKLLHDQGNLHERVEKLRMELDTVQKALDSNPADLILREEEGAYVQAFNEAKLDEERFLKQKAKVEWLDVGDSNSAYFHKSIKCRNQRSRIELILNSNNVEISGNLVPDVFVSHYEQFLGTSMDCNTLNVEGLFSKTVPMDIASNMVRPVTNEEIKAAMFDIGDEKAPGPDGYTSVFFKKGWSIIGPDICNAVRDFFSNGQILKEINHTFLALIPKVATPLKVNDYRPISCCNVIYKCISKILTKRVIEGIKEVGDPLSPYLFTLVMEILTLILKRRNRLLNSFRFHHHCEEIQLINVCFADDLFIFARGDVESARVIMESLEEFKLTSRLVPSLPKSMTYFCNVVTHIKNAILNIMPFSEGELLVKYLGVPLISSRLLIRDCKVLVEKAKNRIWDWKNKSLSFAGRLQLCIIDDIHHLIRGFLWCNGESIREKAKVSWDEIYLPKKEGGLGLLHLDIFNYALMTTHIWNIVL